MDKLLKYIAIIPLLTIYSFEDNSSKVVPTIIQIKKIGELSTLKVMISGDSLDVSDNGILIENTAKYSYKAYTLISTNIENSNIKIDKENKTITISSKLPRVISTTIDFDKTKQKSSQAYTFKVLPRFGVINTDRDGKLANLAYKEVQALTNNIANSSNHIEQAKDKFKAIMDKQYTPMGWKVIVIWTNQIKTK